MKKLARVLAVVMVLVMALSLVGCGLADKLEGKWKGTYEQDGIEVDILFEFNKEKGELKNTISLGEISEDQTFSYETVGDTLLIEGDEVEYTIDGDKLTLTKNGTTFKLEKVEK